MLCLATAKPQHTKMAGLLGLAVVVVVLSASQTSAQLTVNQKKHCGDTWCDEFWYCRDTDHICRRCATICDPTSHSLEEKVCETHCQDFLHNEQFERRHGNHEPANQDSDLHARVDNLQTLATVSLVFSLLLCCTLFTICGIWAKKKHLLPGWFKGDSKKIHDKARYVNESSISTIRLPKDVTTVTLPPIAADAVRSNGQPPREYTHMSTFKTPAPKKPTTPDTHSGTNKSVPGVSRVPSEDSTYAYDNPALTPSPKSTNKGIA